MDGPQQNARLAWLVWTNERARMAVCGAGDSLCHRRRRRTRFYRAHLLARPPVFGPDRDGQGELLHSVVEFRDTLVREYRAREKPIARDLWSAVLFYTTAEFIQRDVAGKSSEAEVRGVQADRLGLATRGWQNFDEALTRHWKPYLDALLRGRAAPDELERALARVVASL